MPSARMPSAPRRAAKARGGPGRRARPGRPPRRRWRELTTAAKVGYTAAIVLTVTAVLVSLTGYQLYLKLDRNLRVTAVRGLTNRSSYGVQNILILGSQTRDGQGPGFGYDPNTNLSDNLLLVHLDATHTHATVVSIPRDTMVYEPACQSRFGHGVVPAQQQAIIDGAMNQGGPSCAVATVEHLTQIRMDHFIEFDFNSFRAMVDTVGGVEVCVPQAVNDPWSGLHLSAGRHLVTGNEALAFVRTRHGVGNGGDLGRIELQQEFFSSLVQKLESEGTLGNPVRLYDIANTATQSLTVDPGLGSISKLLSLASTLRNLHTRNVTFVTMPTFTDPANTNRLVPEQPQDDVLWHMLATGTVWHGDLPATPASRITVSVRNGTGITGLAARTAASLRGLGFRVGQVGDAPATAATTVSYPGRAQAGAAYSLLGALKQTPAVQNEPTGPVTLTLGANFAGVAAAKGRHHRHHGRSGATAAGQPATAPGQAAAIESRNAAENICTGMPQANPDVGTPP